MAHDEQLAWEARAGKAAAVAAFGTAILSVAAGLYLPLAVSDREGGADGLLESADREPTDFIVAGALQSVGLLLLVPVLLYLYRAARYRREQTPQPAAVLAALGGVTLAVVTVLRRIELVDIAHGFFPEKADAASDVEEAAEDEIRDESAAVLQGLGLGGAVALAFGIVMLSLNAMRSGLLSRFMGIVGIFVGVFLVIPLGLPIVQLFWFGALGLLFLGRWPGGRGPAWETGEPIPWPTAGQQREEIERRRAEREQPELQEPEPEPETPRRTSRKRRKKRR